MICIYSSHCNWVSVDYFLGTLTGRSSLLHLNTNTYYLNILYSNKSSIHFNTGTTPFISLSQHKHRHHSYHCNSVITHITATPIVAATPPTTRNWGRWSEFTAGGRKTWNSAISTTSTIIYYQNYYITIINGVFSTNQSSHFCRSERKENSDLQKKEKKLLLD